MICVYVFLMEKSNPWTNSQLHRQEFQDTWWDDYQNRRSFNTFLSYVVWHVWSQLCPVAEWRPITRTTCVTVSILLPHTFIGLSLTSENQTNILYFVLPTALESNRVRTQLKIELCCEPVNWSENAGWLILVRGTVATDWEWVTWCQLCRT